jgi:hypothetical protein
MRPTPSRACVAIFLPRMTEVNGTVRRPRRRLKKTTGLPAEHPFNRDGFRYLMAERHPLFGDDGTSVAPTSALSRCDRRPCPSRRADRTLVLPPFVHRVADVCGRM